MLNLSQLFSNPNVKGKFSDLFSNFIKQRLSGGLGSSGFLKNSGSSNASRLMPSTSSLKTAVNPGSMPMGGVYRHPDMRFDMNQLFRSTPLRPLPKTQDPVQVVLQPAAPVQTQTGPSKQDVVNYFRNSNFSRFFR